MKAFLIITAIAVCSIAVSCKKDKYVNSTYNNDRPRTVRFELYTNQNFAGDDHNIQFSLLIKDYDANKTLFDSTLATMKISAIPDSLHRIIIEKQVPGNDAADLQVGFVYEIENVGYSWYLDEFQAGDTLKVLKYPFQ